MSLHWHVWEREAPREKAEMSGSTHMEKLRGEHLLLLEGYFPAGRGKCTMYLRERFPYAVVIDLPDIKNVNLHKRPIERENQNRPY